MYGIKDCARILAEKRGITQTLAEEQIREVLEVIEEVVVQYRGVKFVNHFSIRTADTKERVGRDPNNPDKTYLIPATKRLKFRAGQDFLNRIQ